MIETTFSQLRQLKLTGMASALQTQLDQPGTYEGLALPNAYNYSRSRRPRTTSAKTGPFDTRCAI